MGVVCSPSQVAVVRSMILFSSRSFPDQLCRNSSSSTSWVESVGALGDSPPIFSKKWRAKRRTSSPLSLRDRIYNRTTFN
jgi:hypothetical protein